MHHLTELLERNRRWSEEVVHRDPDFFQRLARIQRPKYLWIGCADSRVPANQVVGLDPGELFVHRNVANVVVHTDLNCLSVMQFAVEALKVEHIIVCGHYNCGGVKAAMQNDRLGLIDNWLRHIQDVRDHHREILASIEDAEQRRDRLCELNVIEQVVNVCRTTIVEDAWRLRQPLTVHGWIYSLADGRLRELGVCAKDVDTLSSSYTAAIERLQHHGTA